MFFSKKRSNRSHVPSLRQSLYKQLSFTLTILAIVSGLVSFYFAWQHTLQNVDHFFLNILKDIIPSLDKNRLNDSNSNQSNIFIQDLNHQFSTFRIVFDGKTIAGNAHLPLCEFKNNKHNFKTVCDKFFEHNTTQITQEHFSLDNKSFYDIAFIQKYGWRQNLAYELFIAIISPMILLLLVSWIIMQRIIVQQLEPLQDISSVLQQQSYKSLEILNKDNIPCEIWPLINALNNLFRQLKKVLEAQRIFIADASHQLRTPLTAIKLHAERALKSKDVKQKHEAELELNNAANRTIRLSNQLLSLAKIDGDESMLNFKEIDISQLAFEVGSHWVPIAIHNHVDIEFKDLRQNRHQALMVKGDETLLGEALSNLIDNAIKYTRSIHKENNGLIILSVNYSANHIEICVTDNGPGIAKEQVGCLFKRFSRGNLSRKVDSNGAGLGLAIVFDIIALHKGNIIYKNALNGGACFLISLPSSRSQFKNKEDDFSDGECDENLSI